MNEEILKILACPACAERPPLLKDESETSSPPVLKDESGRQGDPPVNLKQEISELVCSQCGRHYPILDGIPNLLVEGEVN
ncbi:MAG: Trm112 family protein [Elusimicrobia bacterium]|nr:Trm112 family protein [Elusimicrobiota bacterium]